MSEFVFITLAFAAFLAVVLAVYNNNIVTRVYKIKSDKVQNNLRIVLLSDLHNKKYNPKNAYITDKVKALNPDIIVVAGDLVDRRRPNFPVAKQTLDELKKITDLYYVTGNHEADLGAERTFLELDCDSVILDEKYKIFRDYAIIGFSDKDIEKTGREDLLSVFEKLGTFKIVVVHRPTEFENGLCLEKKDIDLVLSGHTHGGLIRMPFFGSVYSPNEGFMPKYSKGLYKVGNTHLVVSGGLGNTLAPLRINNFPEIIAIDIEKK